MSDKRLWPDLVDPWHQIREPLVVREQPKPRKRWGEVADGWRYRYPTQLLESLLTEPRHECDSPHSELILPPHRSQDVTNTYVGPVEIDEKPYWSLYGVQITHCPWCGAELSQGVTETIKETLHELFLAMAPLFYAAWREERYRDSDSVEVKIAGRDSVWFEVRDMRKIWRIIEVLEDLDE